MAKASDHVAVWIEDDTGRLSGADAAQVLRDIYEGNRDPEGYRVCVSSGFGTPK